MGECTYYIKARFPKGQLKKVKKQIEAFWKEGQACDMDTERGDLSKEELWPYLKKKFPLIYDYLKFVGKEGEDPHELSGLLDFGQDEGIYFNDTDFAYAAEVWHFAEWEPLAGYIQEKFGANKVVTATEEDGCGSLDNLQLYNCEKIVEDILTKKKLLPLLIGINKDLDMLIDEKIRE